MTYFTEHTVLKIHPCCSIYLSEFPSFLRVINAPFNYGWTMFCLSIHVLMDTWVSSIRFFSFCASVYQLLGNEMEQRLKLYIKKLSRDFSLSLWSVINDLHANAGDTGLTPVLGTKIPHALGQLSLCNSAAEALVP